MAKQFGEDQVGYVKAESTFATGVVPAATDAFRCSSFDITPNHDNPEVPETRNTRSLQERVAGRKNCNFSIEMANRPSGSAGTPPDYHDFLRQAFGTYSTPSSTATYTLLKDPSALSLSAYRMLEGVQEGFVGGIVQSVQFNWGGDQFGTINFSGKAADILFAGTDAANGSGSSATSLIVDEGGYFSKYGIISVATAATTAIQITGHDGTNTLTIGSSTWADNDAVIPYLPAPTLAGNPLYGTTGSLSFDGGSSTISHISGSVSMDTGMDTFDREYGSATPTDVILPQPRRVRWNLQFVIEDNGNYSELRGDSGAGKGKNVRLDIGTTSGTICRLESPNMELDMPPISGGAGLVECSVSGTALTSTAAAMEDEFKVIYL